MGKNRLKELRKSHGMTQEQLSEKTGLSVSYLSRLEASRRDLSIKNMTLIANALDCELRELLPAPTVPLVGYVGAGASVIPIDDYAKGVGIDDVEAPPAATRSTVAAQVRGDSMPGVAEDGWLIYWDERNDPPNERHFGKLCVVGLSDGRVLVKKLYQSKSQGLFTLISTGAEPIIDIVVEWAAPVSFIKPR